MTESHLPRSKAAGVTGRFAALVLLVAFFASAGGCVSNGAPYVTPERLDKGLVIILPGIEGPGLNNINIRNGLMDAGLPWAMEIYNWHGWRPGASYAFDYEASRHQAAGIAQRILDYRRHYPGRPVFLVGHSAGGAMAVFAAESLPPEASVEGVITLAPALSPTYDLTLALYRCHGRMLNCFSETDMLLRGLTAVGENMDGRRGATAGFEGFTLPAGSPKLRRDAFDYLEQMEWDSSMAKTGNLGGHLGWASSGWVEAYVAPTLMHWSAKTSPGPAGFSSTGRSTPGPG